MLQFKRIMSMVLALALLTGTVPPVQAAAEEAETLPAETAAVETTAAETAAPTESTAAETVETTVPETEAAIEETAEPLTEETIPAVTEEAALASAGTCGENVTWSYSSGTLTISGTGEITDIYSWSTYETEITKLVIKEGVTAIPAWAFDGHSNLTSVTIPASMKTIGRGAFNSLSVEDVYISDLAAWCAITFENETANPAAYASRLLLNSREINDLTIPSGVTSIGDYAFIDRNNSGKKNFTSITIPDTVTHIGRSAFEGCSTKKTVDLGDGLQTIGSYAFSYCVISKLTLPRSLTAIGDWAFEGNPLETVTIPANVSSIGVRAFACSSLTSYYVASGSQYFSADRGVLFDRDQTVLVAAPSLSGSYTVPGTVTEIGEYAFTESSITGIILPEGLTRIHKRAFYCCSKLKEAVLPESLTAIGEDAFSNCDALSAVAFPAGIAEIGNYAFSGCDSLTELSFAGDAPAIGTRAFSSVKAAACYPAGNPTWTEEVRQNYGGTLTWVADCKSHIPETIPAVAPTCTEPGLSEGSRCSACGEILAAQEAVPAGHVIEDGICTLCGKVGTCGENVTWAFAEETGVLTVSGTGDMAEMVRAPWQDLREQITSVVICDGVTSVGANAFYGGYDALYENLTEVHLGNTVERIGEFAFCGTGLTEITLPDSVTEMGSNAFGSCYGLTSVTLSAGLKEVTGFNDCTALEEITVPEGVISIGSGAFGASGLKRIALPESLQCIRECAFEGCKELTSLTVPAGVTAICMRAFASMGTKLTLRFLGSAPEFQSNYIFSSTTATVYYPAGMSGWSTAAGQNYGGTLTWVDICAEGHTEHIVPGIAATCTEPGLSDTVTCDLCGMVLAEQTAVEALGHAMGTWTTVTAATCDTDGEERSDCSRCDWYETRGVPASHTIENDICTLCGKTGTCGENLTWTLENGTLTISGTGPMKVYNNPSSIQRPWYAMKDTITRVVVEDGVTTIGDAAFYQLGKMTDISIGRDVYLIGYRSFQECASLKSLTFPENLTTIEKQAFWGCSGLKALYIPSTVVKIEASSEGNSPFYNCSSNLNLFCEAPQKSSGWGQYWSYYKNIYSLKVSWGIPQEQRLFWTVDAQKAEVVIPDHITTIPQNAFAENTALTTITIPATVTAIGKGAFTGCSNLAVVNVSDLAAWCAIAFADSDANPVIRAKAMRLNGKILQDLVIPDGVTSIGQYAFCYNYALTGLTVPDSVTTIGENAFRDCDGITEAVIGSGVTEVAYFAFRSMNALKELVFTGNAPTFSNSAIDSTTTTVYYPAGDPTWTADILKNYGGTLTWVAACTAGHTPETIPGKAATCTATGLTEGSKCLYCGELLTAQTTIPVLGHDMGTWQTILPATCAETGQQRRDCTRCDHFETEVLPTLDHTPEVIPAEDPTCTDAGLTRGSKCFVCGEILVAQEEIPALTHDFRGWQTTAEPTCTDEGQQRRNCARCDHNETEILPALGHTPAVLPAVEATCTATGLTEGSECFACGELLTAQTEVPVLGHALGGWQTTAEPTCTAEGTRRRACTRCDHFETEVLPAVDHTPEVIPAVEPTCTATGLTEGSKCAACGECLTAQEEIPALDHDLGQWKTTAEPTCTTEGQQRRDCSRCDHYETEVLPALTHTYEDHKCTRCGAYEAGSGPLGEDLNWSVDTGTGNLTIGGTGVLEVPEEAPWAEFRDTVTDLTLGGGITSVAPEFFDSLENLTNIFVSQDNPAYADRDGVLFSKDLTCLIRYPGGREDTEYTVPGSVTSVRDNAFSGCDALEAIRFTGNMPQLEDHAFEGLDVTVYYPGGDPTWASEKLLSYGGEVIWVPVYDQPEVLSLTADTLILTPGQTAVLTAELNFGEDAILWALGEGEEGYAALTGSGLTATLTAADVSRKQTVTVTARTAGGITAASLELTLLPVATGLELLDREGRNITGTTVWYDVNSGRDLYFTARPLPLDAKTEITWQHTDASGAYAAYVSDGNAVTVTAPTGATGEVTVTAEDSAGCAAAVTVKFVSLQPETEDLPGPDPADLNLLSGKNRTLKVYDRQTGKALTAKQITWSLDPVYEPYATLTAAGKLTAKKIVARTRIEAVGTIVGSESTKILLTVDLFPPVSQLQLWSGDALAGGKTVLFDLSREREKTLEVRLFPEDVMNVPVKWTVSDGKNQYAEYREDPENNTLTIHAPTNKQGTVTVKATAADGSNKSATVKVKFAIASDSVTIGVRDGAQDVSALELDSGKSIQLTAAVKSCLQGVNPTDTKVTWSLPDPEDKDIVTLSSSGKLTAKTVYEKREVTVRAEAKDGSGAWDSVTVTVWPRDRGILTVLRDGINVTGSTVAVDLNGEDRTVILRAHTFGEEAPEAVTWSPLTNKNANIRVLDDGAIEIQMVSAGTLTLKATAADGSKRTASVTLQALRLADGITVSQKKTGLTEGLELASGKSLELQAAVTGTSSQKVTWSVLDDGAAYATVSSSGKVTAAKDLTRAHEVTVCATAADGSGTQGTLTLTVRPLAQGVQVYTLEKGQRTFTVRSSSRVRGNTTLEWDLSRKSGPVLLGSTVYPFYTSDPSMSAIQSVTWKSSAPKVADILRDEAGNYWLHIFKTGTATVTCTAADGSGQKVSFKLNAVKNITSFTLEQQVLASGKSLNLAKLVQKAPADTTTKKLQWELTSGAQWATLSASGTLKARATDVPRQVEVTVTALDTAGEKATFVIDLYPATTKLQLFAGETERTGQTLTCPTGTVLSLTPRCQPAGAAGKYTWKSSNESLVAVDAGGTITVLGTGGSATVTCTATDGSGKTAKITIRIG